MTRAQVWDRLRADPAVRLPVPQPASGRVSAATAIGVYPADLLYEFDPRDRLSAIRISVGESGRRFVDDRSVPYFYNCLRARFGMPQTALDTYNRLDLYTWDSPSARRTLAAIRYWVPTGKFLLVFISDPRAPSTEETALRKFEDTGRGFGEADKFPVQKVDSRDF